VTPAEQLVLDELELFRREASGCTTCLYAYLTIHAIGGQNRKVRRQLNAHALFWNTTLRALQTALLISLGRVFDNKSKHNIAKLVGTMDMNRSVFSRKALRIRKHGTLSNDPTQLTAYMIEVVAPHKGDFRRIAKQVKRWRAAYERVYKTLRDKIFAHLELTDRAQIDQLFSQTNIRELERMTTFLVRLHDAYWETFHNGRRLAVRPIRHAVGRILERPKGARVVKPVHEAIVGNTRQVLLSLSGAHHEEEA
jgi:HEPN superfamily AbiU2-like protein